MISHTQTDRAILKELGYRLKSLRLSRNMTQEALARAAGVSLNAIKALEKGGGKILTLIAVLRELNAIENLNQFIPVQTISPLQLASLQGKQRQRARPSANAESEEPSSW